MPVFVYVCRCCQVMDHMRDKHEGEKDLSMETHLKRAFRESTANVNVSMRGSKPFQESAFSSRSGFLVQQARHVMSYLFRCDVGCQCHERGMWRSVWCVCACAARCQTWKLMQPKAISNIVSTAALQQGHRVLGLRVCPIARFVSVECPDIRL